MNLDLVICPGCGWTGTVSTVTLTPYNACPKCHYENNAYDTPDRLLTIREMIEYDTVYMDVRMDLFLKSLFGIIRYQGIDSFKCIMSKINLENDDG